MPPYLSLALLFVVIATTASKSPSLKDERDLLVNKCFDFYAPNGFNANSSCQVAARLHSCVDVVGNLTDPKKLKKMAMVKKMVQDCQKSEGCLNTWAPEKNGSRVLNCRNARWLQECGEKRNQVADKVSFCKSKQIDRCLLKFLSKNRKVYGCHNGNELLKCLFNKDEIYQFGDRTPRLMRNIYDQMIESGCHVNECYFDACGLNKYCLETDLFECKCISGFEENVNGSCSDIDECTKVNGSCPAGQLCKNTEGGFECSCSKGYEMNSTDKACIDIDECAKTPTPCSANQMCLNTKGGYMCPCKSGYELTSDGNCTAIAQAVTDKCSTGLVSYYADPADCGKFFQCAHNKSVAQDCANGTVFNEAMTTCVNIGSREDKCSSESTFTCTKLESIDKTHCPETEDKNLSGKCNHQGQCLCKHGFVWNGSLSRCQGA